MVPALVQHRTDLTDGLGVLDAPLFGGGVLVVVGVEEDLDVHPPAGGDGLPIPCVDEGSS
jgi:hypothetical protein